MNEGEKRLLAIALLGGIIAVSAAAPECSPTGCASHDTCSELKWDYARGAFDRYDVEPTFTTPEGTPYDPSGMPISPQLIDRLTDEVNGCLVAQFPNGQIPADIAKQSECSSTSFELPIDKRSFVVKVANDWILSCTGDQQLLPINAGDGCQSKGEVPTAECPCRWRAGIQCPNRIVVTPSFYIYKDALVRFTTSCQNPWASAALATCAAPSTTPLNDGSDPNNGK